MSDLSKKMRELAKAAAVDSCNYYDVGMTSAQESLWIECRDSIDRICAEIEALEKENAEMRAKIDKPNADTERAYQQGFHAGMRAAQEALNRASLEIEPPPYQEPTSIEDLRGLWVDPSPSDSALYRAMAADPKSYPPEKPRLTPVRKFRLNFLAHDSDPGIMWT